MLVGTAYEFTLKASLDIGGVVFKKQVPESLQSLKV